MIAKETPLSEKSQDKPWIIGVIKPSVGLIPVVSTWLETSDRLGAVSVRVGLRRMHYAVEPGLYAVGSPTPESPVFVSANYKLSFDHLRRELHGIDGWIMVIDTKGINVWCAAGKGTFGTQEIVYRMEETRLSEIVSHRKIIIPQLGAPGVSAYELKRLTHFDVVYGPVKAKDIPEFMNAGMQANPGMRRVNFTVGDRLVLTPVDFFMWGRYVFFIALALFFLAGFSRNGYTLPVMNGGREVLLFIIAFVTGSVLVPVLLPWLPGRALSLKGITFGLFMAVVLALVGFIPIAGTAGILGIAAWVFIMPAVASFLAMNFTGATTYTSLSGVRKEMRFYIPLQIAATAIGLILWIVARFF